MTGAALRYFARTIPCSGPGSELGRQVLSRCHGSKMDALINIDVPDLNAAVDFYTSAVDLRLNRFISDGVAELSGASSTIYLLWHPEGTKPIPNRVARRHYSRHWTPVHLDFVVADIESAVQKARAAGAQLERPIVTHKWGKLALMADPFGHGFCFIQFLGRCYDQITE